MASETYENVIEVALKSLFCKITKIAKRLEALPPPQAPSVIRLSCISLLSTGPKLDSFVQKKFTFGSSLLIPNKILVVLLVAFTAADRFFKRLYGPDTKRAKKCSRPYTSFFQT